MKRLFILLLWLGVASGCGIDPKIEPTINVVPPSAVELETAQCSCPALPPGNWILVPKL